MKEILKLLFLPVIVLMAFTTKAKAPYAGYYDSCGIKNTAFQAGEKVTFKVY